MIAIVFRKKEKLFCKFVVPSVFVDEIVDDIAAGHDADEAPPVVLDGDEGVLLHLKTQKKKKLQKKFQQNNQKKLSQKNLLLLKNLNKKLFLLQQW